MALCALGTGHSLAQYDLTSGCSSIPTGLVLQLPIVLLKIISNLINKSWIIACASSGKFLLSGMTLCRLIFFVVRIYDSTCMLCGVQNMCALP